MPYKDPEKQRKAWVEHYHRNKQQYLERNRRRRAERQTWLRDVRAQLRCVRCGEDDPATLDFHHRDPAKKDASVSLLIRSAGVSLARVEAEIAKCDVLCANCHRKEHSGVV